MLPAATPALVAMSGGVRPHDPGCRGPWGARGPMICGRRSLRGDVWTEWAEVSTGETGGAAARQRRAVGSVGGEGRERGAGAVVLRLTGQDGVSRISGKNLRNPGPGFLAPKEGVDWVEVCRDAQPCTDQARNCVEMHNVSSSNIRHDFLINALERKCSVFVGGSVVSGRVTYQPAQVLRIDRPDCASG